MRLMKFPEEILGSVAPHWYATAVRDVAVSMPPARYPLEAGLHPSQVSSVLISESNPASKGPAEKARQMKWRSDNVRKICYDNRSGTLDWPEAEGIKSNKMVFT